MDLTLLGSKSQIELHANRYTEAWEEEEKMRQQSDVGLGNEATIFSYTGLEEFFFNSTGLSVGS